MTREQEIDTQLAEMYGQELGLRARLSSLHDSAKSMAGAVWYYQRRNRVTDMTYAEAREILDAAISIEDAKHPDLRSDYARPVINGQEIMRYGIGQIRENCAKVDEVREALKVNMDEQRELNGQYTGWSRFFLVTSSKGHIHSSMRCSTCRPTTTYGWLPSLSGLTEADAVAEHGPALCSVCFPSAPVEWVGGWITKSQAEKKAA